MHKSLKFEQNSRRRAHRCKIPLHVSIDRINYETIDWSLTGLSIKNNNSLNLNIGDTIKAFISLPMPQATLSIIVDVKLIYKNSDRLGFSYENLSYHNKKVLRRYLEMAIDGSDYDLQNLFVLYQEPQINTPINTSVKLEEQESDHLDKEFKKLSWKILLLFFLLFSSLAGLLYYNLKYSYKGMGVVKGNDYSLYAQKRAKIDKIYVKEGDEVRKGSPLVQLDTSMIMYKIKLLESEKNRVIRLINELGENGTVDNSKRYLKTLKDKVASKRRLYLDAKKQFKEKLITAMEFQKIKDDYLDSKIKLAKSISENGTRALSKDIDTSDLDIKLAYAKNELKLSRIVSIDDARVYEIYKKEGEIADVHHPIMSLWTHNKPHIEIDVPNDKLSQISKDTKVEVIDPYTKKYIKAKIYKIGTVDEENDLKSATIYLRIDDSFKSLKPHQRVHIFFRRGWF